MKARLAAMEAEAAKLREVPLLFLHPQALPVHVSCFSHRPSLPFLWRIKP